MLQVLSECHGIKSLKDACEFLSALVLHSTLVLVMLELSVSNYN